MKKITLAIAILALLGSIATFFYTQERSKLVYVDVNKLLDGYKRTKVVKAAFEKKAKVLRANVDSLVTDW